MKNWLQANLSVFLINKALVLIDVAFANAIVSTYIKLQTKFVK